MLLVASLTKKPYLTPVASTVDAGAGACAEGGPYVCPPSSRHFGPFAVAVAPGEAFHGCQWALSTLLVEVVALAEVEIHRGDPHGSSHCSVPPASSEVTTDSVFLRALPDFIRVPE